MDAAWGRHSSSDYWLYARLLATPDIGYQLLWIPSGGVLMTKYSSETVPVFGGSMTQWQYSGGEVYVSRTEFWRDWAPLLVPLHR